MEGIFNVARGRVNELFNRVATNDGANSAIIVVLAKASEADNVLEDYATLGALLAAGGNTEADFTNYARKVLTDTDINASTVDNSADTRASTMANQVFSTAGGATNNTLTKVYICFDPDTTTGDDTNIEPLMHYDFAITTNGADITAAVNASGLLVA